MSRRALVVCLSAVSLLVVSMLVQSGHAHLVTRVSDTTNPIVEYGANGTKGTNDWYKSPVTVWIRMNGSVNYTLDDHEWQSYVEPIAFNDDGNHSIELRGYINETSNESVRLDINIDTKAPTTEGNYTNETLKVTLESSDVTSGVEKIMYRVDGGAWKNYTAPFKPSAGEHVIQYYSIDKAGNQELAKSMTVIVPENLKPFEAGVILSLLVVGLGAFLFLASRGRRPKPKGE